MQSRVGKSRGIGSRAYICKIGKLFKLLVTETPLPFLLSPSDHVPVLPLSQSLLLWRLPMGLRPGTRASMLC